MLLTSFLQFGIGQNGGAVPLSTQAFGNRLYHEIMSIAADILRETYFLQVLDLVHVSYSRSNLPRTTIPRTPKQLLLILIIQLYYKLDYYFHQEFQWLSEDPEAL